MTQASDDLENMKDEIYRLLERERMYALTLSDKRFAQDIRHIQEQLCIKSQKIKQRLLFEETMDSVSGLDIEG